MENKILLNGECIDSGLQGLFESENTDLDQELEDLDLNLEDYLEDLDELIFWNHIKNNLGKFYFYRVLFVYLT